MEVATLLERKNKMTGGIRTYKMKIESGRKNISAEQVQRAKNERSHTRNTEIRRERQEIAKKRQEDCKTISIEDRIANLKTRPGFSKREMHRLTEHSGGKCTCKKAKK